MISMLVIQSVWDCRYRQIPIGVTVVGGCIGLILSIIEKRAPMDLMLGVVPGIFCLLIGWITREAIGYGDGFLLCAMGMYLSFERVVAIAMLASVFAGIAGLALMVIGKKKGKDQIPFVPFLLVAAVIHLISERGIYL